MADPRITALCRWFRHSARDLPWRRQRTAYAALVAESMLQQTQVARVVERFTAFMAAFPDVQALADADLQHVLQHWNGLGYYRRARNLHAAAQRIVSEYDGAVPLDVDSLMQLPGVGRYTAGAIASIIGGAAEPIVDGNVRRVLMRWFADIGDPSDRATEDRCWNRAAELVSQARRPGVFNEALMELGATICTPKTPQCERCPVAQWCMARVRNRQADIPKPKRPAAVSMAVHHAVVVERRQTVLLEQRPARGLWAGLWQPPAVESERRLRPSEVSRRLAFRVERLQPLGAFAFQTSSQRVEFRVFKAVTRMRRGRWLDIGQLDDVPMSNAHRRVLQCASVGLPVPG